jgi:hypothetical protein
MIYMCVCQKDYYRAVALIAEFFNQGGHQYGLFGKVARINKTDDFRCFYKI